MTAGHEDLKKKAAAWAAYAEEDLRLAGHTLGMEDCPYRLVAYHAQQCAEKYIKAYLVTARIDFPFTHNLSLLLELAGENKLDTSELADADELSRYAITTRYPGMEADVSEIEARRTIALAEGVRSVLRKALSDRGVSI